MSHDAFVTARLAAERLRFDHADEIHRMHQDAEQMSLLGGVRTELQTAAYMERNLAHWERYGFGLWLLRDRITGDVVGRALLRHLDLEGVDEVEVGYSFFPAYWGRGLATEVTVACLARAREMLGLPSVVALTLPHNLRSQRVMTKAGMRFEHHLDHDGQVHALFRTPR